MKYWRIVLWNSEEREITAEQADRLKATLEGLKPGENRFLDIEGEMIATGDIRRVEETSREILPELKQIGGSTAKTPVQFTSDGSVKMQWLKKYVNKRQYTSYYLQSPGYYKIGEDGSEIVVAFLAPAHKGSPLGTYVCSDVEVEDLERLLAARGA